LNEKSQIGPYFVEHGVYSIQVQVLFAVTGPL